MSNDACTVALRNGLDEIRNVCPGISTIFVFRENGEMIVNDENTSQANSSEAQEAFRLLADKAKVLGGVESITVQGTQARINIARFDDFCATNVSSNEADEKTVTNLTRIMIPAMLKMVKHVSSAQQTEFQPKETLSELEPQFSFGAKPEQEMPTPQPEAAEFTVENLNVFAGLQSDPDSVQIDNGLLAQWYEMFGSENIAKVKLESPVTGKQAICKFAPFKDSKYDNKGIIQVPKKIQDELVTHKGAHVLVTPIVEKPKDPEEGDTAGNGESHMSQEKSQGQNSVKEEPSRSLFNSISQNSQFMVENLNGISKLVRNPDFIRVENAVMSRWKELFADKEIKHVIIEETVAGKRISCKVQTIKKSDLEGKGVVQMPEKMQQALRVKKGALVLVKPVVD